MRVETEECFSLMVDIFLKDAIEVFKVGGGHYEFSDKLDV